MRAGVTSSEVRQPRAVGHRRDVAVAGRRDADRRVVEASSSETSPPARVAVAVALDVRDERDEQQQGDRRGEPHQQPLRRALATFGQPDLWTRQHARTLAVRARP